MPKKSDVLSRIGFLQGKQSLKEFCERVGLNYDAMKKSRQRQSVPDTGSLSRIAAYFRVDLNWLVSGGPDGPPYTQLGKNLKLFRKRKGWRREELADRLSVRTSLLEAVEKGAAALSLGLIQDLAKQLDVPFAELFADHPAPVAQTPELKIFAAASSPGAPAIRGEDYVSIPLIGSAIAAGHPIIQNNRVEDYVLLHVRAAGKRRNLVASRVDGDSMEPMLHSGDIVVIDRDDKKMVKNKIYAIFFEEGLTAKYVERQRDLLILRPINPLFQVLVINLGEQPDPIVGRIIGAWKEL